MSYLMLIELKSWMGKGCKTAMPTLKHEKKKK